MGPSTRQILGRGGRGHWQGYGYQEKGHRPGNSFEGQWDAIGEPTESIEWCAKPAVEGAPLPGPLSCTGL